MWLVQEECWSFESNIIAGKLFVYFGDLDLIGCAKGEES